MASIVSQRTHPLNSSTAPVKKLLVEERWIDCISMVVRRGASDYQQVCGPLIGVDKVSSGVLTEMIVPNMFVRSSLFFSFK